MKKIIVFILISVLCLSSFCSCELIEKANEAHVMVRDFISALEQGDFEAAMTYVHPASGATAEMLENMVLNLKDQCGVDIADGVEYVGQVDLYTNSSVGVGGEKTIKHDVGRTIKIDGRTFEMAAVVLENSAGYGILSFEIKMSVGF